jgi:kynurenine formamidase
VKAPAFRTAGIDYLSIGHGDEGPAVYRALLGAQIFIVEGLNFSRVEPGEYDLACLPLRIRSGGGAPTRALLRAAATRLVTTEPPAHAQMRPCDPKDRGCREA